MIGRWAAVLAYVAALYALVPFAREVVDGLRARGMLAATMVVVFVMAASTTAVLLRGGPRPWWRYALAAALAAGIAGWAWSLEVIEERVHLAQYALLAVLVGRAMETKPHWMVFAVAALLGIGDEALQAVVPSRVFDWRDLGFNVGAAALGTLLRAALAPRAAATG